MLMPNVVYSTVAFIVLGRKTRRKSERLLLPTGREHVRTSSQAYDRDCLLPTVKHGSRSVMIWANVSSFFQLKGRITFKYRRILADQVQSMMQTLFPGGD
ncbi:hypothetical protein TNCV_321421 [Trichonephila clavipes]|nr:hypothetical protein TNCV_321421 [Trichonephila clavipes]